MAANDNWTVYVPDRSAPLTGFPGTMTAEEVQASLVASGYTSVENTQFTQNGKTLRFQRVTGGTKGL